MIDWTELTRDPVDSGVRRTLREWLLARRLDLPNNDYDAFLVGQVKGKSVLDIGVCEHTSRKIQFSQLEASLDQGECITLCWCGYSGRSC